MPPTRSSSSVGHIERGGQHDSAAARRSQGMAGELKVWGPWNFVADPGTSKQLAESFPTVPWGSPNSHALAVGTWPARHLITATVAGAVAG